MAVWISFLYNKRATFELDFKKKKKKFVSV